MPETPLKIYFVRFLKFISGRNSYVNSLLLYIPIIPFSKKGVIVICDRWPIKDISIMDGPVIRNIFKNTHVKKNEFLCKSEEVPYSLIGLPDQLILLDVNPETAVDRKKNEPKDYVRKRNQTIKNFNWSNLPVQIIDANKDSKVVREESIKKIWDAI